GRNRNREWRASWVSSRGRHSNARGGRKQVATESTCFVSGYPASPDWTSLSPGGLRLTIATPELRPAGPVSAPELREEAERIRVFCDYALDSLDEDIELAAIARFAARLCEAPVALVSLVEEERQR